MVNTVRRAVVLVDGKVKEPPVGSSWDLRSKNNDPMKGNKLNNSDTDEPFASYTLSINPYR